MTTAQKKVIEALQNGGEILHEFRGMGGGRERAKLFSGKKGEYPTRLQLKTVYALLQQNVLQLTRKLPLTDYYALKGFTTTA